MNIRSTLLITVIASLSLAAHGSTPEQEKAFVARYKKALEPELRD